MGDQADVRDWDRYYIHVGQQKVWRHLAERKEDFQNRPQIIELESMVRSYGETFYDNLMRQLKKLSKYRKYNFNLEI